MSDVINEAEYSLSNSQLRGLAYGEARQAIPPDILKQQLAQQAAAERRHQEYMEREAAENAARVKREARQAAVHAALLIEGERATADDVLRNAARFAAFLAGD